MVEITLLGRVATLVGGTPLSGEAAQRRRLALLALLADPPTRPMSRDRLMLHLWPDNDTASARHLLSAALHVVRKALGPEVIRVEGEHVNLDPALVRVDVAEFEEALQAGDSERALDLYGGPFLDGLFLPNSPEFEQWRDGRRAELADRWSRALEGRAETREAQGLVAEAVDDWRRLVAHDPYSAGAVCGLMRTMAAGGDRAGALQVARVHQQLMESEFDAAPDPEVVRLAERLRLDPPEAMAPAPRPGLATPPAPPRAEPPRHEPARPARPPIRARWAWLAAVLVAGLGAVALASRGTAPSEMQVIAVVPRAGLDADSAGDFLGYAVAEEIDYELGRSARLRVLNRGSSFLYRDSVLDPRDIGRRLSADLLVTVSARLVGDRPRVRVELLRTVNGHRIWDEQYDGPRVEQAALNALAGIGHALRLGPSTAPPPGRRAATTSPEAYYLYQQGRFAWSRRTPESLLRAVALLQQAVEADPGYVWAHVGLADAYNMLGSYDYGVLPPDSAFPLARQAALRAIELDRDLAPAHAALANVRMHYDWDWPGAEAGFRRAIELNPGYTPSTEWLANLKIAQARVPDAVALLQEAIQYNSASALILTNLAHAHYYAREYDVAYAYLDRAMEADPHFARAHLLHALVQCLAGSPQAAVQRLEPMAALSRTSDPILAGLLGYAYALSGRPAEARAQADWLGTLGETRFVPSEYAALIHLGLGEHGRSLDLLETAMAMRSSAMIYLRIDPIVDPLRHLPRFRLLLDGVPEA